MAKSRKAKTNRSITVYPHSIYASDDSKAMARKIIGMRYNDACAEADKSGFSLRVYKMDGRHRICTRDYRTDRINVNVEDGKIVDTHVG